MNRLPRLPALLALVLLLAPLSSAACSRPSNSAAAGAGQRAIQNKGSDTMVNLALAWAEVYREQRPDVAIAVTGGGSGTGIAALINGTVDIANASREMKDDEIEEARANGMNAIEDLKDQTEEIWEDAEKMVKKHPARAIGLTLLVGVVIGALLSRDRD